MVSHGLSQIEVKFRDRHYKVQYWSPENGVIGRFLALDTETTLIREGEIPYYILGAAYADSDAVLLIKRENLKDFVECHKNSYFIFCNAAFDIHVIEKATGNCFGTLIENRQILDAALLYQLVSLAKDGALPESHSLAYMSKKFLGIELDKSKVDDAGNLVQTSFEKYLRSDGSVDNAAIPFEYIEYLAKDALSTWEVHKPILAEAKRLSTNGSLLTHATQVKAAYALDVVERNGFSIDPSRLDELESTTLRQICDISKQLIELGWSPGSGSKKSYEAIIRKLEAEHEFVLPRTKTGKISAAEWALDDYRYLPFVKNYLDYHSLRKLESTFIRKLKGKSVVFPHFKVLVSTGRTASYNPNFQNFPRDTTFRQCFVPRQGHLFVIADYSTIELCTLAQTCINRYGKSKMADLINQGMDLHRWFASIVLKKNIDDVTKEDRLYAKACNFGFPGGLGVNQFLNYARSTYGIEDLTYTQAKELKNIWLSAFPEMKDYLASLPGESFGSRSTAQTITGRLRANCTYTQARNFPFQGLAADGAKLALYRLIKSVYRVVNYVHDEFVVEIPDDDHSQSALNSICDIMSTEMGSVCPSVNIGIEASIAREWIKH